MKKLHQTFWDNGNIKEKGFLRDGEKFGDWEYFNEDGSIAVRTVYLLKNDVISEMRRKEYKILDGITYVYHGNMRNGIKDGKWSLDKIDPSVKMLKEEWWFYGNVWRSEIIDGSEEDYELYEKNLFRDTHKIAFKEQENQNNNFGILIIIITLTLLYLFSLN